MTTSTINHRRATSFAAAATGCVGALLALSLPSGNAAPPRDDSPTGAVRTVSTTGHYVERGCFIAPPTWNQAIDATLPRCRTYLP